MDFRRIQLTIIFVVGHVLVDVTGSKSCGFRYCDEGKDCCNSVWCVPEGSVCCGGGYYCEPGQSCCGIMSCCEWARTTQTPRKIQTSVVTRKLYILVPLLLVALFSCIVPICRLYARRVARHRATPVQIYATTVTSEVVPAVTVERSATTCGFSNPPPDYQTAMTNVVPSVISHDPEVSARRND